LEIIDIISSINYMHLDDEEFLRVLHLAHKYIDKKQFNHKTENSKS
jgi:hypothetical protein